MSLIAEVSLRMPVSMWDITKTAEEVRSEIFKKPEDWQIKNIGFDRIEFEKVDS